MTETATIATDGGTESERQCDLKRQLLARVVQSLNGVGTHTASDAFSELLCDAHEEMAQELLAPIFGWSDCSENLKRENLLMRKRIQMGDGRWQGCIWSVSGNAVSPLQHL